MPSAKTKKTKEKEKKSLVVKSNKLNLARYELNKTEVKLFAMVIARIKKDEKKLSSYTFSKKELLEKLGLGQKHYEDLKRITHEFLKKVITIKDDIRTIQTHFFSSVEYNDGDGWVEFSFDPKLRPYLLRLRANFVSYNLEAILSLSSVYAHRFYEWCTQWKRLGGWEMDYPVLREILGIDSKQYPKYANFKQKVLLVAQKELKDKAEIFFEFEEIKERRKVVTLKFKIRTLKNHPQQLGITDIKVK
jgi:plasmid replication initiation protein